MLFATEGVGGSKGETRVLEQGNDAQWVPIQFLCTVSMHANMYLWLSPPRGTVNQGAKCLRLKAVSRSTNSNHTQGGFLSQARLGDWWDFI